MSDENQELNYFSGDYMFYAVFSCPVPGTENINGAEPVPFTGEEIAELEESLKTAIEWINAQAESYEVPLNLEYYIPKSECLVASSGSGGSYAFIEEVANQLGYDGYVDFGKKIEAENEDCYVRVLGFCGYGGLPYSEGYYYSETDSEEGRLESTLIPLAHLARQDEPGDHAPKKLPSPAGIAKAILQAYGAIDLIDPYQNDMETFDASRNAYSKIPDDIMRFSDAGDFESMDDYEISEFTAFFLGWQEEPKNWYSEVVPPSQRERVEGYMSNFEISEDEEEEEDGEEEEEEGI